MIEVLAFPKYKYSKNPVLSNLYKLFDGDREINVIEFDLFKPFYRKCDIFHIHWPDYFFVESALSTIARVVYFLVLLNFLKIKKTKIVWTIHNLTPHHKKNLGIYMSVMRNFVKHIHAVISMSEYAYDEAVKIFPGIKIKKKYIIPHGLYQENYKNYLTREESRMRLGLSIEKTVLLFFGNIKKYKNVPKLIDEFNKNCDDSYVLIIAGRVQDQLLKKEIRNKSKDNPNIILECGYIEDDKVQEYFNACDLVVLPFSDILNSGSAMLALTFRKPVYCPLLGSIHELQEMFGQNSVIGYEHFSLKEISEILNMSETVNDKGFSDLSNKKLSMKLKVAYLDICNDKRQPQ